MEWTDSDGMTHHVMTGKDHLIVAWGTWEEVGWVAVRKSDGEIVGSFAGYEGSLTPEKADEFLRGTQLKPPMRLD